MMWIVIIDDLARDTDRGQDQVQNTCLICMNGQHTVIQRRVQYSGIRGICKHIENRGHMPSRVFLPLLKKYLIGCIGGQQKQKRVPSLNIIFFFASPPLSFLRKIKLKRGGGGRKCLAILPLMKIFLLYLNPPKN